MGRPPVPPGEPTGLNKERPGQSTDALLTGAGSRSRERRLPGSHNPGDGQAVGTVNTCEPAIKIVKANEPKWLSLPPGAGNRLEPKGAVGRSAVLTLPPRGRCAQPVDSRYLPPHMLRARNVETPYISRRGASLRRWERREAGRSVCGLGMSEEAKAVL